MRRRLFTSSALLLPGLAAAQADALEAQLRTGGCVLVFRHAQTVAGVGDPEGFRIDLCSTQRNLSDVGRAQARSAGQWFKQRRLQPRAVFSSAWCRCKDTADLAFGRHVIWPALNSFFDNRSNEAAQSADLRQAIARVPSGQFDVWVTHQVNMTALTSEVPAMGEAFVLGMQGKMVARRIFP